MGRHRASISLRTSKFVIYSYGNLTEVVRRTPTEHVLFPSHFVWDPNTSMFGKPSGFLQSETHARSMCEPMAISCTEPKVPNSESMRPECVHRSQQPLPPAFHLNPETNALQKREKRQSTQEQSSRYEKGSVIALSMKPIHMSRSPTHHKVTMRCCVQKDTMTLELLGFSTP